MILFQQQESTEIRNRIRAAWATFSKYRQELTSKNYLFEHRLRLFDPVITPTICYASGTWTPTKEHERMIQSTQRKNAPTHHTNEKKIQKIVKQKDKTNEEKDTNDMSSNGDESEDGQRSNTHKDQDSNVSFESDNDEEIDTTEIEEENWVRTNSSIGRPRERWEDDINEFLTLVEDETENFTERSSQMNKTWINTATDRGRWTLLEEKIRNDFTRTKGK